jgi:WD40 repeat protein
MDSTGEEMNLEADTGLQQPEDEGADDTPAFVDMNDVVEIQVDDDAPMNEDGDDMNEASTDDTTNEPVMDMSKAKVETHTDAVYAIAGFMENDKLSILSGGGDDKAFLHKVSSASSESKNLSYNHTDTVSCVAFNMAYVSSDLTKTPRLAAVGSYDGAIVIYDPDTAEQKSKLEGPSDVEWLCFHPKGGSVLLAGSGDGTVWMFHIPLNRCLQVFVGHEQAVTSGCFSPDGKWALSASADGTLRIWAPKTGMNKHVFRLGEAGLTCMASNGGSDGMLVLVGSEDGNAHVCHIGTKKVVTVLRHYEAPLQSGADEDEEMEYPKSVEAVGFSPSQSSWCATGGVDGRLKIWDLSKGGQCRHTCVPDSEEADSITHLRWHPKLPVVFTATISGKVRLWDARNGSLMHTVTGHTETINDIYINCFDNGVTVIVSTGDDKSIRVFEVDVNAILQQASTAAQQS